jgi:hypothetical protein
MEIIQPNQSVAAPGAAAVGAAAAVAGQPGVAHGRADQAGPASIVGGGAFPGQFCEQQTPAFPPVTYFTSSACPPSDLPP